MFSENRAFYVKVRKNTVDPDRPHMTKQRIRIAYWTPKAADTHSEYETLTSFPLQQRL